MTDSPSFSFKTKERLGMHPKTVRSCEYYKENLKHYPLWRWLVSRFISSDTQIKALEYIRGYSAPTPIQKQVEDLSYVKFVPAGQGQRVTLKVTISQESFKEHGILVKAARSKGLSVGNVLRAYNELLEMYKKGYQRPPERLNKYYGGKVIGLVNKYIVWKVGN